MPLVADVSVVLVVDVVVRLVLAVLVGGRHAELGHEPGVPDAFLKNVTLRFGQQLIKLGHNEPS